MKMYMLLLCGLILFISYNLCATEDAREDLDALWQMQIPMQSEHVEHAGEDDCEEYLNMYAVLICCSGLASFGYCTLPMTWDLVGQLQ